VRRNKMKTKKILEGTLFAAMLGASIFGCNYENITEEVEIINSELEYGSETFKFQFERNKNLVSDKPIYGNFCKVEIPVEKGNIVMKDIPPFGNLDYIGFQESHRRDYILAESVGQLKEHQPERYNELLPYDQEFYERFYGAVFDKISKIDKEILEE